MGRYELKINITADNTYKEYIVLGQEQESYFLKKIASCQDIREVLASYQSLDFSQK